MKLANYWADSGWWACEYINSGFWRNWGVGWRFLTW